MTSYNKRPTTARLKTDLLMRLRNIHVKKEALLSASNINRVPSGRRVFLNEKLFKKNNWAGNVIDSHKKLIMKDLIRAESVCTKFNPSPKTL